MIIARTPFRVSFFGGGTDFQDHYTQHGGAVLLTTINQYCYLSILVGVHRETGLLLDGQRGEHGRARAAGGGEEAPRQRRAARVGDPRRPLAGFGHGI